MKSVILSALMASGAVLMSLSSGRARRLSLVARISPRRQKSGLFAIEKQAVLLWWSQTFRSRKAMKLALSELPDVLEILAVPLIAGEGIFAALARVVPRANGVLPNALQNLLIALELGADLETELEILSRRLPQQQVVEFASKLSLSLRRGSPLAQMLREQAASARAELRNELYRQAGRNDTRMLIPLVFLILPVTVLFAIYPSLQLISISYL